MSDPRVQLLNECIGTGWLFDEDGEPVNEEYITRSVLAVLDEFYDCPDERMIEVVTTVLMDHLVMAHDYGKEMYCSCGWRFDSEDRRAGYAAGRAHQAKEILSALAAARTETP